MSELMSSKPSFAVAVLGVALSLSCAKRPDDAAIVSQIQSEISSNAQFNDSDLHIVSANGEVTISGTVPTVAAHLEVYKIATKTPGVTKVNDLLKMPVPSDSPLPAIKSVATPSELKFLHPAPVGRAVSDPAPVSKPEMLAQGVPIASAPPELQIQQQAAPPPKAIATPLPPALPPQPRQVEIPANTTASIRMIDSVDSSVNHAGEIFHGMLEAPFIVEEQVIVPRGADVYVRLVSAKSAGRFKGKSELHLQLIKIDFQGRSYQLVSSTYSLAGASRGANTAKKTGAGAVLGAIIGGIAGGGTGAAIGATVGGGAGAAVSGLTRGKQVKIPAETMLDFQLEAPVTFTVMPRRSAAATAAQ